MFLAVRRTIAQANNWKIIQRHPLANEDIELLDYEDGMAAIDWPRMNARDYADEESKSICMAECLSPETVASSRVLSIYVKTAEDLELVQEKVNLARLTPHININQGMFLAN